MKISVQENFLAKEKFDVLSKNIMGENFPWFFNPIVVDREKESPSTSPGQLVHVVYAGNSPQSALYESDIFIPILQQLNVGIIFRIKMNLHLRRPEPFYSRYHIDILYLDKAIAVNSTTSIFYINTNNGYTEFEDGTIVKSVANRLVTFPLTTKHRGISQTDEQTRYVINFNYLKQSGNSGQSSWTIPNKI
jgi:hypothetical protein